MRRAQPIAAEAGCDRGPTPRRPVIAVAYSGGRDSTALLHCTLRQAAPLGIEVVALHVNHGLLPQADEWQRRVQRRCADWARRGAPLRLLCEKLVERPAAGDSIEAWARQMRYQALRRMALAAGCDAVLLAHHERDQAETFLLQALRGAGVSGLASMPAAIERDAVHWLRPWLRQPREAIDAYVRRHRLVHVDDPSNADLRLARSRLRSQVWPALRTAFPQAEQVLADAAARAADAAQCLAELAAIDLVARVDAEGRLLLAGWQSLSPARQSNALRAWLLRGGGRPAPAALVGRLMRELAPAAAQPRGGRLWQWGELRLEARSGTLGLSAPGAGRAAAGQRPAREASVSIDAPGCYPLPGWHATLVVEPVAHDGVPLARLANVELRARGGSERFQAGPRRPPRSLKKQFQAAAIPAWERDGALLYSGDELLFVAGLGIDARVREAAGPGLVRLRWQAGTGERD